TVLCRNRGRRCREAPLHVAPRQHHCVLRYRHIRPSHDFARRDIAAGLCQAASRGKVVRAEPVAALYEQRRIHHVGAFPTLEDQMCAFAPDFDRTSAGYSPDRVDALVWAFTDLLVEQMSNEGIYEWTRRQAEALVKNPAESSKP